MTRAPVDLGPDVAVVTGVCGRLGPIWVEALLGAGARVVGLDRRTDVPSTLRRAIARHDPARWLLVEADVTVRASLVAALDRSRSRWGTPTILVNNAGLDQPPGSDGRTWRFGDVPDESSSTVLDVNAQGTLRACQVFGSAMAVEGGGSIVNIGSLYGSTAPDARYYDHLEVSPPFLKPPAYGMSKAAVASLTRYLAALWGPHGVRVNTLSPGGVLGDQDAEFRRKFTDRVPLGRMAATADLGGPLLFLASGLSSYVTGTELLVDGGYVCW